MFLTLASNTRAGTYAGTLYIFLGGTNQCMKWKLNKNILPIGTKSGYIVSLRESTLFRVRISDGPISRGLNWRESFPTCRGVGRSAKLLIILKFPFPSWSCRIPNKIECSLNREGNFWQRLGVGAKFAQLLLQCLGSGSYSHGVKKHWRGKVMKDGKSPIFLVLAKDFPGIQMPLFLFLLWFFLLTCHGAERCHLAHSHRILRKSEVTGNHSSIHLRSDRFN